MNNGIILITEHFFFLRVIRLFFHSFDPSLLYLFFAYRNARDKGLINEYSFMHKCHIIESNGRALDFSQGMYINSIACAHLLKNIYIKIRCEKAEYILVHAIFKAV